MKIIIKIITTKFLKIVLIISFKIHSHNIFTLLIKTTNLMITLPQIAQ